MARAVGHAPSTIQASGRPSAYSRIGSDIRLGALCLVSLSDLSEFSSSACGKDDANSKSTTLQAGNRKTSALDLTIPRPHAPSEPAPGSLGA
jgi:hypothetical protein